MIIFREHRELAKEVVELRAKLAVLEADEPKEFDWDNVLSGMAFREPSGGLVWFVGWDWRSDVTFVVSKTKSLDKCSEDLSFRHTECCSELKRAPKHDVHSELKRAPKHDVY